MYVFPSKKNKLLTYWLQFKRHVTKKISFLKKEHFLAKILFSKGIIFRWNVLVRSTKKFYLKVKKCICFFKKRFNFLFTLCLRLTKYNFSAIMFFFQKEIIFWKNFPHSDMKKKMFLFRNIPRKNIKMSLNA